MTKLLSPDTLKLLMTKRISAKTFILSQILILTVGLVLIGALYLFVNSDNPAQKNNFISQLQNPITKPPTSLALDLNQPEDESLTFKSTTVISGKTAPNTLVLVSSQSRDLTLKSDESGAFSTSFDLEAGVNDITVVVFSQNGQPSKVEKTVYYSKEKL